MDKAQAILQSIESFFVAVDMIIIGETTTAELLKRLPDSTNSDVVIRRNGDRLRRHLRGEAQPGEIILAIDQVLERCKPVADYLKDAPQGPDRDVLLKRWRGSSQDKH